MQKDQWQEKHDRQVVYNAYGKILNYSSLLSLLWLLSAYFLFPWLFAIYPLAPLFLGLESSRETHHLSRPKEIGRWQKNFILAAGGASITLASLFVAAPALPVLIPLIPFLLIGLMAVNTLHIASIWAKTLYNHFSTDRAERTTRMKLELAKASVGLLFQAGTLAAITCTLLLATPFVQIVATAAMAGAILLLIGARLFTSYKMAQIQKNELFQSKEKTAEAPKPEPKKHPSRKPQPRKSPNKPITSTQLFAKRFGTPPVIQGWGKQTVPLVASVYAEIDIPELREKREALSGNPHQFYNTKSPSTDSTLNPSPSPI